MNLSLIEFDSTIKNFLTIYLLVVAIGVLVGLTYLGITSNTSKKGIVERYNGSNIESELDIPEQFPKGIGEMLVTTHNHILGLATLLLSLGLIIYFSSINNKLKNILMFEPLVSLLITFGSIWLVRYVHNDFVYLTIISAVLMYSSIFLSIGISVYELKFKKEKID